MHKFISSVVNQQAERVKSESKVMALHYKLMEAFGIYETALQKIPHSTPIEIGSGYVVVKESRCFSRGWVDVLEISTEDCPKPGYSNTGNPYWISDPSGTTAINLPPDTVIVDVINLIQASA